MLTIHAFRMADHVLLPAEEFRLLVGKVLELQSVEVIETEPDDIEAEDDRQAYLLAVQELEHGDTVHFDDVKSRWLHGEPAHV